jgi:hypothetical protein
LPGCVLLPASTEEGEVALEVGQQGGTGSSWRGRLGGRRIDILIGGVLAALTLVVHNVHYILTTPFWFDESWVAASTKLSLSDAPHVTSVTPLGWTVLLRGVFFGGPQGLRLVALGFATLSVVVAFLLARSLSWSAPWQSRAAGALAGLAVLLVPSSLVRNDLKPYTADAFVALTLLLLLSRLEADWTRRRLVTLAAASVGGFLISVPGLFVAVAIFATMLGVQLVRRDWRRAREATLAGAVVAVCLAVVFVAIYQPHVGDNLTTYWRRYYLPVGKGIRPTLSFLRASANGMAAFLGMGPALIVAALVVAGLVTVSRSGRLVLACVVPVLLAELMVLGAARKYPFFDERTSHFFTVTLAVFAAIGVAGFSQWLSRFTAFVPLTVVAVLVALFIVNVRHDIGDRSIPGEDVTRPVTAYVNLHHRPNDVIVVSELASFSFSYYWPHGTPSWHPSTTILAGFEMYYPKDPNIIVATHSDASSIRVAMNAAAARMAALPGSRLWLIRQGVGIADDLLWNKALTSRGLSTNAIVPCYLMLATKQTGSSPDGASASLCYPQNR